MSGSRPPKVRNAPGLVWKPRKNGFEARWQARTDLVERGYEPRSVQVWVGAESELSDTAWNLISDRCRDMQTEMLVWGRGGVTTTTGTFDGTLGALAACYQSDPDSTYRKTRYRTRKYYDTLCRMIVRDHGSIRVADIRARQVLRWHEEWSAGGKITMGHALVGMLRSLLTFGATLLGDEDCKLAKVLLHDMRFEMGKPRTELLTADHANAIRAKAHEMWLHSVALAQAFQFEGMLRQKDVIGEWVPESEPGLSEVTATDRAGGQVKWLRGIRWSEIDGNLILRHMTSKRQKMIEIDLRNAPMVMEELARLGERPTSGPIIKDDATGKPYAHGMFRAIWRKVATAAGVPKAVKNMDSRAGAITEATEAGAQLEHVRHAATHGDISMTQRYSRGSAAKVVEVQKVRVLHRNKK